MAYPYSFKPGIASGVGTGAERFALLPPSTTPVNNGFMNSRYLVRKSLRPEHTGYMKLEQQFSPVDLRGNGLSLQGQLSLQALIELQQGKGAGRK
jgi:hypothetical protein